MDFNEFFEGYSSQFNNSNNSSNNNNTGGFGCNDMPGGFQDLDPNFFVMIGSLVGDAMSQNLPFNVQNAIGNWLQLVGQAIETYNAQQQYFQNGPGRFYDLRDRNVGNPTCSNSSTGSSASSNCECKKEIKKLKKEISYLYKEIEKLKSK